MNTTNIIVILDDDGLCIAVTRIRDGESAYRAFKRWCKEHPDPVTTPRGGPKRLAHDFDAMVCD